MLSKKEIICPEQLLKLAKIKGPVKVVIVNAGKAVSIESTKQAVDEGLIDPIFVGDKKIIDKLANDLKWDISNYEVVDEPGVVNSEQTIRVKFISETGEGDGLFNLKTESEIRVFKVAQGIDIEEANNRYVAKP